MSTNDRFFDAVSDMEDEIATVRLTSEMLSALASSPSMIRAEMLYALSRPLSEAAGRLTEQFDRAVEVSRGEP